MDARPIASRRHTLGIILILVAGTATARFKVLRIVAGGLGANITPERPSSTVVIVSLLLAVLYQWGIVGVISLGIRRRGFRLSELIAPKGTTWKDVGRDALIGIGFAFPLLLATGLLLAFLVRVAGWSHAKLPSVYLPQNPAELAAMLALCVTAGICEEIIFRGYFQRQLLALTKSPGWALIIQALLFGLAHTYLGPVGVVLSAFLGLSFGWLANRRQSLRPTMTTHALWDIVGTLARYYR